MREDECSACRLGLGSGDGTADKNSQEDGFKNRTRCGFRDVTIDQLLAIDLAKER